MCRWLYFCLLRLHPRAFRLRFGPEMLGVFDEHAGAKRGLLFVDAIISLFRQRVLRPAHPEPTAVCGTAAPMFQVLDASLPRRSALIEGAVLSLAFFSGVTLVVSHAGDLHRLLVAPSSPTHYGIPMQSSASQDGLSTEIKVKGRSEDASFLAADLYFGSLRLLNALDANEDRIISAQEGTLAPAVLARLDRNHDGKLSPQECGFPQFSKREPLEFMRTHPVLTALDTDHNGEISADEIRSSTVALKTLDANGDGILTPLEVMPNPTLVVAQRMLLHLDLDGDGKVSPQELKRLKDERLRGFLEAADRDRDGVTTSDELTKEIQRRDELKKEMEDAMRSNGSSPLR